MGNLLEDVFDLEIGELLFTLGGMVGASSILGAAILWLTVKDVLRWSGPFLLAFVAGAIFPDDGGQILMAIGLMALGLWLWNLRDRSRPQSISA